MSDSLRPHGLTAACQASLSLTISWSSPKFMSFELVMLSNYLILCCPLLLLPSILPSVMIFSSELAFCIRWPKYWRFSIILSMNIQGRFPLALNGRISCCPRVSKEYSPARVWKHQFLVLSLLYGPTLTTIPDYWKDHSFDYMDLCWQRDVFVFLIHCLGFS